MSKELYPDGHKTSRVDDVFVNVGEPDRKGFIGYKDYITDFYYDYPGGVDGVVDQAKEKRKQFGEFNSKNDKALAPQLDDWTLNRKNPAFEYNKGVQSGPTGVLGGLAQPNSYLDNKNRTFSPVYTFDQTPAINPYNRAPTHNAYHPMSEEMAHGAQDTGVGKLQYYDVDGFFGDEKKKLPYAARNAEMGAKLTNMKQDYIQRNWRGGKRKDKFNRQDAENILDKFDRGINGDAGMQQLRMHEKGRPYMKENKEYFLNFLESTVKNDQRPAGLFTGRGPQNA